MKLPVLSLIVIMLCSSFTCQTKKLAVEKTPEKDSTNAGVLEAEVKNETEPTAANLPETTPEKGVQFVSSEMLKPLLDQAKVEGKLIFIDFYADWCTPCKLMDEKVFTDEKFAEFMNENFINYKVDMEKGPGSHLVTIYEVRSVPTLLFLDQEGEVLVKKAGAAFQTELTELAEKALVNLKKN